MIPRYSKTLSVKLGQTINEYASLPFMCLRPLSTNDQVGTI